MFCHNCGKQIDDKAVVCVHCGFATLNFTAKTNPNEPANTGLVFLALIFPMIGIMLGVIENSNGKKRAGKAYLTAGIASAAFWIVFSVGISIFCTAFPLLIAIIAGTAESSAQSSHNISGCLNMINNIYGGML